MRFCDVLIEESFLNNQTLTYSCQDFDVVVGSRVWVKVRNRDMMAFVDAVYEANLSDFKFDINPIESTVDDAPIINQELYALSKYMSKMTVTPLVRCLQTVLPNKLRPQSSATKPKMEKGIQFVALDQLKVTQKQQAFIDTFKDKEFVRISEARAMYTGFRKLVERGVFRDVSREVRYEPVTIDRSYDVQTLTPVQQEVFDTVVFDKAQTYLLHGVTGSGKTEVYLQLAAKVLEDGKSVLFLVPEISLTPQMIDRVSMRFGEDVAIYHSGLNDQEKYEQYLRILHRKTRIVVGTRSAMFMPFDNLGLIVLDEEHDSSYKQGNMPMYHTSDLAIQRSQYHQCPLILGSASPRLETYARALKGVYTLLELPQRINNQFPKVTLIDTKQALYQKESAILTPQLMHAIQQRLDRREQIILVLNRRGYMTFLKDLETQEVLLCPNCDISLNYHKAQNVLKCHQCDYVTHQIPLGSDHKPLSIVGSGVGTQRLEEYLNQKFEGAKIARMDRDTTSKKGAHHRILTDFNNHKYDILVGTQMISKGLDIENVTLVGILNIDAALGREDFSSVEDTFNLILQASGRSGRGDKPGEVMIQTFNVDHYAVQYAVHNQYKSFFKQEMQYRKLAQYPPYTYLISIVISAEKEIVALNRATNFIKSLNPDNFKVLGPSLLIRIKGLQRVRVILKGRDLENMLAQVHLAYGIMDNKGGVRIDVNPIALT